MADSPGLWQNLDPKPRASTDARRSNLYDSEQSNEYLSFLLMDPVKSELFINQLRTIFADIDPVFRSLVLKQAQIILHLRVIYNDLALNAWKYKAEDIKGAFSEAERLLMLREYTKFVDALAKASLDLDTAQMTNLFTTIAFSKLSMHNLFSSLFPSIIGKMDQLNHGDVLKLTRATSLFLRNYFNARGAKSGLAHEAKSFLCLLEESLKDIITIDRLSIMMTDLASRIETSDFRNQLTLHYKMLEILLKMVRVSSISTPHKKLYLDKLTVGILSMQDMLKTLDHYELLQVMMIIENIVGFGRNNPYLLAVLDACEQLALTNRRLDKLHSVMCCVRAREIFGDFNRDIFERIEAPLIIEHLEGIGKSDHSSHLLPIIRTTYGSGSTNYRLHEVIVEQLERLFNNTDQAIGKMYLMKGLHQMVDYGIRMNKVPVSLIPRLAPIANQLSAFCICNESRRLYDKRFEGEMPDSIPEVVFQDLNSKHDCRVRLLECTNDAHSKDFVLNHYKVEEEEDVQVYHENYNEVVIKEALVTYVPRFLAAAVEFRFDLSSIQACSYKWDALLEIEGVDQVVGFEVTGQAYTSDYSGYALKKQIKFDILAKKGYIPVLVQVGSSKIKSFILENNIEALGIEILDLLRRQVKALAGVDLQIKEERFEEYQRLADKYLAAKVDGRARPVGFAASGDVKITPAARKPAAARREGA